MSECLAVAVGMFILGTIAGIFVIALVSGGSYEKGHKDGYRDCQQNEELH